MFSDILLNTMWKLQFELVKEVSFNANHDNKERQRLKEFFKLHDKVLFYIFIIKNEKYHSKI